MSSRVVANAESGVGSLNKDASRIGYRSQVPGRCRGGTVGVRFPIFTDEPSTPNMGTGQRAA